MRGREELGEGRGGGGEGLTAGGAGSGFAHFGGEW